MMRLSKRFRGLYWRQMVVTVGMVLLTLTLLGAAFFSLSYNYARGQKTDELESRARIMSQLSVSYLEGGRYLSIEELRNDPDFQQLASFAATVSDVQFMICDTEGHVLLSTDVSLSGKVVTIPEEMTRKIMEEGSASDRDDLGGIVSAKAVYCRCGGGESGESGDGGRGICCGHYLLAGYHVEGLCGPVLYDRVCGAHDFLYGLLCDHHAAGAAHSGHGQSYAAVCRRKL